MAQIIDEVIKDNNLKQARLKLNHFEVSEGILKKNWVEIEAKITELYIFKSNIQTIEEDAFSEKCFEELEALTLDTSKIAHFDGVFLKHLKYLDYFAFNDLSPRKLTIEVDALEPVKTSLYTLQFQQILRDWAQVKNLTGNSEQNSYSKLLTLDVRFNQLQELEANAFVLTPNLQALHLEKNALQKLHRDTFKGLRGLKTLYLSDNSLRSLPEGIFDSLNMNKIYIDNNPFDCDCNLEWLKSYMLQNPELFPNASETLCHGVEITQFEFDCSDGTTPLESVTPQSPETTTNSQPLLETRTLRCTNSSESKITGKSIYLDTKELTVRDSKIRVKFYDLDLEAGGLKLRIEGNVEGFNIIWFQTDDTVKTGCEKDLRDGGEVILGDLRWEETYTFCFVYENKLEVSPYDCFGRKMLPARSNRTWINYKYRAIVIGCGVSLIFGEHLFNLWLFLITFYFYLFPLF